MKRVRFSVKRELKNREYFQLFAQKVDRNETQARAIIRNGTRSLLSDDLRGLWVGFDGESF